MWSPRTLPTNKQNSTSTVNDHPDSHNAQAAQGNGLTVLMGNGVLGPYEAADNESFPTVERIFVNLFQRLRDLTEYVQQVIAAQLGEILNRLSQAEGNVSSLVGRVGTLENQVGGGGGPGGGGGGGRLEVVKFSATQYNFTGRDPAPDDLVAVLPYYDGIAAISIASTYSYEPSL